MPFQPYNYADINPLGIPYLRNFIDTISSGYKAGQLPGQLEREKRRQEIANAFEQLKYQQEPQKFSGEMTSKNLANDMRRVLLNEEPEKHKSKMLSEMIERAFQQANINKVNTLTPLEANELKLKNQFYPELTKSKMRNLVLSGLGTGAREGINFENYIARDNPNFNPEESYEAANAVIRGKFVLNNGKKINPLSEAAKLSLDRLIKYSTTNQLINQGTIAEQADKEIDVLSDYISKGIAPYGDTYNGYNLKQIMDSVSSDKDSQIRAGRFLASQVLQTDLAAVQNRLNSGTSTATITNEILERNENIKPIWAKLSNTARQESIRYLKEALHKGLEARRSVGIGASSAYYPNKNENTSENSNKKATLRFNIKTGELENI